MHIHIGTFISLASLGLGLHILRVTPADCHSKKLIDATRGVIALSAILLAANISLTTCRKCSGGAGVPTSPRFRMLNSFFILAYALLFSFMMVLYSALDDCVDDDKIKPVVMTVGIINLVLAAYPAFVIIKAMRAA